MILKYFTDSHCSQCRVTAQSLDKVLPKYPDLVMLQFNPIDEQNLISEYHLTQMPTLILCNDKQEEVKRVSGALSIEALEVFFDEGTKLVNKELKE